MKLKENERIDDLEYKGLKIIQDSKGFCFGMDSILLSDYAKNLKKGAKVIDIGTGSGIIGLLLCKKTSLSKIIGIEIQEDVAEMAKRSIELNNLQERFELKNINIKKVFEVVEPNTIDVVVTNPPYMKINTGAQNLEKKKLISRHEIEVSLEDVIKISYKLLKSNGEFYMVHRAERLVDILFLLRKNRLEPKQIKFVHSKIGKAPNLVLIKSIKNANPALKIEEPLIIYEENGEYTEEIYRIYNKERR